MRRGERNSRDYDRDSSRDSRKRDRDYGGDRYDDYERDRERDSRDSRKRYRRDRDRDRDRERDRDRDRDSGRYKERDRERDRDRDRYDDKVRRDSDDDKRSAELAERKRTRSNSPDQKDIEKSPVSATKVPRLNEDDEKEIQSTSASTLAMSIEERMKRLVGGGDNAAAAASSSTKLKTAIHPSLIMDPMTRTLEMKKSSTNVLLPKASFATVKANVRGAQQQRQLKLDPLKFDTFKNPYFDRTIGLPNAKKFLHKPKKLRFAPAGKFVAAAEKMRLDEQRKLLEKKIAETTERAGLELDVTDSLSKLEPIPAAEWWDCQFLASGSYDAVDDKGKGNDNVISWELVTHLVHHPVPISAPTDGIDVAPRALMLTEKERKRLRRQRRLEVLKDKQERVRIGLLPPDAPKVKLSNIMRVLGDQAIQDPSKVEAMVRKQVAERRDKHERMNADSKLTDEQVRAKKIKKLQEDQSVKTHVALFKVNDLSNPKFQFKVDMNAKQNYLTGCALVQRKNNLVVVEGGPKGIKRYKNLMLNRIKWNESQQTFDDDDSEKIAKDAAAEENFCHLVWEGSIKEPLFKEFALKVCEMEIDAKLYLQEHGAEHYWKHTKDYTDVQ